ncbi:hypothetical protein [Mycobacterium celatum]|uniref:Lipoprotein LpqE n=1 Tax=Mycobacterium celatum TaxID=28045 RepID=A0A1X1RWV6_MYCCE|nr:hypothetical protein [Mycobacterium celatum]ORV19206.1 hypothetical protein AWB95_01625 [Mycobacterium celatum]PIB76656.1 hypothetical protein CQY23_18120 [Mycobacterium celatum]
MNRLDNRRSTTVAALAAGALAASLVFTGCGSGQLSQTAAQVPAVDGASAAVHDVALRNVHIQAVQTGDFLRPGQSVDLVAVVSNQSPDTADKLVAITTDIGTVTLSGDTRLPSAGMLFVGTADGQNIKAVNAVEPAHTAKATVALTKPITNGLTYNFTFIFEKAGSTSVPVPISAGLAPRKSETPVPAQHP